MSYLLLLKVPEKVCDYVAQLQDRFDFKKRFLEPHITLVPPFKLRGDLNEKLLLSELEKVGFNPFKQVIDGIDFFEGKNNVIFLDVVMNNYLMKLYLSIRNILEPVSQRAYGKGPLFRSTYKPHITVAKRLSDQKFLKAKSELLDENFDVAWRVRSFWIYNFSKNNKWKPMHKFEAG